MIDVILEERRQRLQKKAEKQKKQQQHQQSLSTASMDKKANSFGDENEEDDEIEVKGERKKPMMRSEKKEEMDSKWRHVMWHAAPQPWIGRFQSASKHSNEKEKSDEKSQAVTAPSIASTNAFHGELRRKQMRAQFEKHHQNELLSSHSSSSSSSSSSSIAASSKSGQKGARVVGVYVDMKGKVHEIVHQPPPPERFFTVKPLELIDDTWKSPHLCPFYTQSQSYRSQRLQMIPLQHHSHLARPASEVIRTLRQKAEAKAHDESLAT